MQEKVYTFCKFSYRLNFFYEKKIKAACRTFLTYCSMHGYKTKTLNKKKLHFTFVFHAEDDKSFFIYHNKTFILYLYIKYKSCQISRKKIYSV